MPKLRELLRHVSGSSTEELLLVTPGLVFRAFPFGETYYHTERVVYWSTRTARELGENVELVQLTAWLHDIGYYEDPENHREVGARAVEERLRELGVEDIIEPVVDGIRNHGTKDTPATITGHIVRFADAIAVWDPQYIGFYLPVTPVEELRAFKKILEKKEKVLREYEERWPWTREMVNSVKGKTLTIIEGCEE